MNDHHRDWSSLPSLAISGTAKLLNAVDHLRFRSVCSEWRRRTGERQKAPLVILADLDIEDDSIRALSFFDIIGKTIIPLRPLAYQGVPDSHYLGSSRGWIFIGKYTFAQSGNQDRLKITLLNPFTEDNIINLPLLDDQPWGRVFLSGTPTNLQNDNVTVLYYIVCDDFVSVKVYFIRAGQNRWTSFLLNVRPENVVACEGHFYATFEGVLSEIDLENRRLANVEFVLPGLLDVASLNSAFPLRFLEDLHGRLHLFLTSSYRTNSYCFLNVVLFQNGPVNMHRFEPPLHYWTERCLVISDDFSVESRHDEDYVNIDDYYPFRLLLKLSRFWNYGRNQWEPVGWITPTVI